MRRDLVQLKSFDTNQIDKLLQQIQRKFGTSSSNSDVHVPKHHLQQALPLGCPCDVAIIGIGKELGSEFLELLLMFHKNETNEEEQRHKEINDNYNTTAFLNVNTSIDNKKWIAVQEKVLECLCDECIPSSIPSSFFETLILFLKNNQSKAENIIQIEKDRVVYNGDYSSNLSIKSVHGCFYFVSNWLIHIDHVVLLTQNVKNDQPQTIDRERSSSSSTGNVLYCCIRLYAIYYSLVVCCATDSTHKTILNAGFAETIYQTLLRLESKSARLTLIMEIIDISLLSSPQDERTINKNVLQTASYVLTSILSSVMISKTLQISNGEKQKILSHINRQAWAIWRMYQSSCRDQRRQHIEDETEMSSLSGAHEDIVLSIIKDCMYWILWMNVSLDTFLNHSMHGTSDVDKHNNDICEGITPLFIAQDWLSELVSLAWFPLEQAVDLISSLAKSNDNLAYVKRTEAMNFLDIVSNWISKQVLRIHLPKIIVSSHLASSVVGMSQLPILLEAVIDLIGGIVDDLDTTCFTKSLIELDSTTTLRICSTVMISPHERDRVLLMELVSICVRSSTANNNQLDFISASMLRAISLQFFRDPACRNIANEIHIAVEDSLVNNEIWYESGNSSLVVQDKSLRVNIIDLMLGNWSVVLKEDRESEDSLMDCLGISGMLKLTDVIANISSFINTRFSALQQAAALLYGIALLDVSGHSQGGLDHGELKARKDRAYNFLQKLVHKYPHLGIALLTVVSVRLNQASFEQDGSMLIRDLQFMCSSLVADSLSAQEVWALVGIQWMNPQYSPITLRIALIRLFPALVDGNKRMYRRIMDCLGHYLSGKELGTRLAAAATITDLAKKDHIRGKLL
jgi:hypothetical protein